MNVRSVNASELDRAVDQVLQVGRRERARIGRRMKLRRDLPRGRGLERDAHRTILESARPHQRRGNIDVRVRGVDRQIRAVELIAEDLVADAHRAVVRRHVPLRRIRALGGKRHARAVVYLHVVDVPGELVDGVSALARCGTSAPRAFPAARRETSPPPASNDGAASGKLTLVGHRCLCERRRAERRPAAQRRRRRIPNRQSTP